MKRLTHTILCFLLSLLLASCRSAAQPDPTPPETAPNAPVESLSPEGTNTPVPETTSSPDPVSLSYLSVSFTAPSPLEGTVSAAAEPPPNVIRSLSLPSCDVSVYHQPSEEDETRSVLRVRVYAAGQQYDWALSNRYVSGDCALLSLEGLFGLDAFAVQWNGFYYYYTGWDGTDARYPELLFYREGTSSLCDTDGDGQAELIIPQGHDNKYTLALLTAGGEICRLSFQADRPVADWTGLLSGDPFIRTLKAAEPTLITAHVQPDLPEGYTLSASKHTAVIRAGGEDVGYISRQSAPHHDPDIEQGQITFENGQPVNFRPVGDHYIYTDHQPIDGCAAPAVIAHSLYDPPYEDGGAGNTHWVICFAEESGYVYYRLTLDTACFTREQAIELARSVQFFGNAFLIPSAEVPNQSEAVTPTPPDYTDLAQSVYTSIVGEQGSRDCSVEVFDPADGTTTHIHLTEENIWNLPDTVGKYPPPSSSGAAAYQWTPAEPCSCTDPLTLTLRSPDGTASLTCHKGCDNVTLTTEDAQYLLAAEAPDRWPLFNSLLGAVDDALVFIPMTSFLVAGSVTDYEAVVEKYARHYGDYLNALPDWLPSKPKETVYSGSRVSQAYFGEGTENFCAGFGFYLSPEMGGSASSWEAGAGLAAVTEGEHAGWWGWGTGADFARNENGDWYCTGTYTGGEWLRYPTRLEDSSLEQMVYYFYHTTPGHAHDYLIPYYVCLLHPASSAEELNRVLNTLEDPAPFCTALGSFLRDYGDYDDIQLTFDVLSRGLDAPFAAWLKEGFSPVIRSTAYDTRVTEEEVVLHNGVRPGMTYEEVCALLGMEAQAPAGSEPFRVGSDDIDYTFYDLDGDGVFLLKHIYLSEAAIQASIFRNIKIGDSMESIFPKIPARDTELKKWAHQALYGSDARDSDGYAWMEFVANSYYVMRFLTPETPEIHVMLTFSRDQFRVKWIDISYLS